MFKLIVCDLDNTLYDWVGYFVPSFYEMVDKAVEIINCDREQLLNDFRLVHQKHQDSEHPFALLETKLVTSHFKGLPKSEIAKILDPAFHAFNSTRKRSLFLHRGVRFGLEQLFRSEVLLVAHTESKLYGVVDRLKRLSLTKYFSKIYCRERPSSSHPDKTISKAWLDSFPMDRVTELSKHQMKPNVEVLLEICSNLNCKPAEAAYVGDSVARDVLMAKRAGVFAVWAEYGAQHDHLQYEKLVRVTHWTPEDVEREKGLAGEARGVVPDFIAKRTFAEVLEPFGIDHQPPSEDQLNCS